MSLPQGTCPLHGVVSIHPGNPRHTCGNVITPREAIQVDAVHEPARNGGPAVYVAAVEPSLAERAQAIRNEAQALRVEPASPAVLELSDSKALRQWVDANRALMAAIDQEIRTVRERIQTDSSRLVKLETAARETTRLLAQMPNVGEPPAERTRRKSPTPRAARDPKPGPWAPRSGLTQCRGCGTSDKTSSSRHAARGLCYRCLPNEASINAAANAAMPSETATELVASVPAVPRTSVPTLRPPR